MSEAQVLDVQQMLATERLAIDSFATGRTTFLSHVGAVPKLVPGAWLAHREVIRSLALSTLNPKQRKSLANSVLVDYDREFGVGRLKLRAYPSGLPMGGSSLVVESRVTGIKCFHTWALNHGAEAHRCDWLLLEARRSWSKQDAPPSLTAHALGTFVQLGKVLVLVDSPTSAREIGDMVMGHDGRLQEDLVSIGGHPRLVPFLHQHDRDAALFLHPQDALDSRLLVGKSFDVVLIVGGSERTNSHVESWLRTLPKRPELLSVELPGRLGRLDMEQFWRACGKPKVLLRGDAWDIRDAEVFLKKMGATVASHGDSSQLGLLEF